MNTETKTERAHARFAPSSAARWTTCTASIPLIESLPPDQLRDGSKYAAAGSAAHELMAQRLTEELCANMSDAAIICDKAEPADQGAADASHVELWLDTCLGIVRETGADLCFIEQKFSGSNGELFGTVDFCCVNSKTGDLGIADYKHGEGVFVEAQDNKQLAVYMGLLRAHLERKHGIKVQLPNTFTAAIVQPRHRMGPPVRMWRGHIEHLRPFWDRVSAAMVEVNTGDTAYAPSESACRFCPAVAHCPEQKQLVQEMAKAEFADADSLAKLSQLVPAAEISPLLKKAGLVRLFAEKLEQRALEDLQAGKAIPGLQLTTGRPGNREWTDLTGAVAAMEALGIDPHDRKIKSPTAAYGALSKKKGVPELDALIQRAPGKPKVEHTQEAAPALNAATEKGN